MEPSQRLREIARLAGEAMDRKFSGEISIEEFYRELMEIHRKYPDIGPFSFKDAAESFRRKELSRETVRPKVVDLKKRASGEDVEEEDFEPF